MKIFLLLLCSFALQSEEINFCNLKEPHAIDIWYQAANLEAEKKNTSLIAYTNDIIRIQDQYYAKWFVELEATYRVLNEKLDVNAQMKLETTQKSWLVFFQNEIKLLTILNVNNGQLGDLNIAHHKSELVKDRACQLLNYTNHY